MMAFNFMPMAEYVSGIALLDIDEADVKVKVLYIDEDGNWDEDTIEIEDKGDNSYQVVEINQFRVRQVVLMTPGSAAVASISFCPGTPVPPTPVPPTPVPPTPVPPTPVPSTPVPPTPVPPTPVPPTEKPVSVVQARHSTF